MSSIRPFLRWAGGKRWIAPYLAPYIRGTVTGRYLEPFVGSGAMFFAVEPRSAVISDLNSELIDVYKEVARSAASIEDRLAKMSVDRETYYSIRESKPATSFEVAVRFIYLNRTCFGGLHRTNKAGEFNVPYGGGSRTPEIVYRDHLLLACSKLLKFPNVTILSADFEESFATARRGDVIFCDPTYRAVGRDRFDRYGPTVFSWSDQKRLANAAEAAHRRGAVVIIMNADDSDIAGVFEDAKRITVVRSKSIGNAPKSVERHRECIFIFEFKKHAPAFEDLSRVLLSRGLSVDSEPAKSTTVPPASEDWAA